VYSASSVVVRRHTPSAERSAFCVDARMLARLVEE
jgi:hypothetical protein